MHKLKLAIAVALAASGFATTSFAAEPVPCEQSLSDLKAAIATSHLSDADSTKVADFESQGIERCKADDDTGADELFAKAMTILGK